MKADCSCCTGSHWSPLGSTPNTDSLQTRSHPPSPRLNTQATGSLQSQSYPATSSTQITGSRQNQPDLLINTPLSIGKLAHPVLGVLMGRYRIIPHCRMWKGGGLATMSTLAHGVPWLLIFRWWSRIVMESTAQITLRGNILGSPVKHMLQRGLLCFWSQQLPSSLAGVQLCCLCQSCKLQHIN